MGRKSGRFTHGGGPTPAPSHLENWINNPKRGYKSLKIIKYLREKKYVHFRDLQRKFHLNKIECEEIINEINSISSMEIEFEIKSTKWIIYMGGSQFLRK